MDSFISIFLFKSEIILVFIDSLDGFTFRNQLTSIMLVVATGQHLHTIWGPPKVTNKYQKMLKLDDAFFERMAEKM